MKKTIGIIFLVVSILVIIGMIGSAINGNPETMPAFYIFIIALFLTGVYLINSSKKHILENENKLCPMCAKKNRKEAIICSYCSYLFTDKTIVNNEFLEWRKNNPNKSIHDFYTDPKNKL
jgi:hypothetical protein